MLSVLTAVSLQVSAAPASQASCVADGQMARVRELPEASGVAASRRTPGLFWAHNDSGDPIIVALDGRGAATSSVSVTGAAIDDWEDIAVASCPQGSCVYIADIGDNNRKRGRITVYRVPEPGPQDRATEPADVFEAVYPDGAHDAEALFVTADSGMYILTKGDPGPVVLYQFPPPLTPGKRVQLQRVGAPMIDAKKIAARDRPTAADVSPDGKLIAVRTTRTVVFYRTDDVVAGRWREAARVDVSHLDEPRGEGITFAGDRTLVLVGEGGRLSGPGTFVRLACTLGNL